MSKRFSTKPHAEVKLKNRQGKETPVEAAERAEREGADLFMAGIAAEGRRVKKISETPCISETPVVSSLQSPDQPATNKEQQMTLEFVRSNAARKDNRLVIFNFADGRPGSVQFLRTAFGDNVPNSITMDGDFAEKPVKAEKIKETPEERKARLASLPKLTLAERVKKAEERTAKLREKLAKEAA